MSHIGRMFLLSKKPLLICGQPMNPNLDEAVCLVENDESYVPDLVLYIGGSIVSKRLKKFLRKAKEVWSVNASCEVNDTFMNLTHVVQGDGDVVADQVRFMLEQQPHPFVQRWDELLERARQHAVAYEPPYSQMAVVKCLKAHSTTLHLQIANSTAIRLANIYACHNVYCNRGVNGIDGSLSTAAGFSLVTDAPVLCVIGDLSFFYDQNALWNQHLTGSLRILLLNNGKGAIFDMLPGLEQSPARNPYVAAGHRTTAEGICRQCAVGYRQAVTLEQMQQGIDWLVTTESEHPLLLEVLTDAAADVQAYKTWLNLSI
jgi:2-succinyl-5-enolpyruvyl-6-hydroxy-3-cyclohexene-1-carboxylate synthase